MYVTRGEGVKKFEIFMDVIDGSPYVNKVQCLDMSLFMKLCKLAK